jgi:uncharacterized protein YkwD
VHGASPNREQDGPLSLAARLGLYALLAGLVLASFTVTPERRAPVLAEPTNNDAIEARILPMSRGVIRGLRLFDEPEATPSPSPATEATADAAVQATADPQPADSVDPQPEVTPDPTPEPTPVPTPRPTPAPAPAPRPAARQAWVTNATSAWAEIHMLELINASRLLGGLVPLTADVGVGDTARAHSAAEAQVRYVYHDGPDGTAHSRDMSACGTGWYGENTGKIWNDNVDALHREFMAEPWEPINHRTNIMDPAFRRIGVGAVIGPDAMYMTMVFCR